MDGKGNTIFISVQVSGSMVPEFPRRVSFHRFYEVKVSLSSKVVQPSFASIVQAILFPICCCAQVGHVSILTETNEHNVKIFIIGCQVKISIPTSVMEFRNSCIFVAAQIFHAAVFVTVAVDDVEIMGRSQVVQSTSAAGMERMDGRLPFDISQMPCFHVAFKIGADDVLVAFLAANIHLPGLFRVVRHNLSCTHAL